MIQYSVFEAELEKLKTQALLREIRDRATPQGREIKVNGKWVVNFASNDYLGLADHPALKEAAREAVERYGTGAGASRLLSGGCMLHKELEARVAAFKGTEAALLLGSGYAANTGIIPALARKGDAIFSDELNHASIIDGCRLSPADTFIYRHRETVHLEELLRFAQARRKLVVTDSVFSMDGEIAPLEDIYRLCRKHDALLYLDDAHGTGVLGNDHDHLTGRGALASFCIMPQPGIIQMGTFSKALGSYGAFVAGDAGTISWLVNSARSLICSTALPPPVVASSIAALDIVEKDSGITRNLWDNRERLLEGLQELGYDTGGSETPIVPVMCKGVEDALALSARLLGAGIYAPAIRPPTVREPRVRLTVTAAHTGEDINRLLSALAP